MTMDGLRDVITQIAEHLVKDLTIYPDGIIRGSTLTLRYKGTFTLMSYQEFLQEKLPKLVKEFIKTDTMKKIFDTTYGDGDHFEVFCSHLDEEMMRRIQGEVALQIILSRYGVRTKEE